MNSNFEQFSKNVFIILQSLLENHPTPLVFTKQVVNNLFQEELSEDSFERFYEAINWLIIEGFIKVPGSSPIKSIELVRYSADFQSRMISIIGVFITAKGLAFLDVNIESETQNTFKQKIITFISDTKDGIVKKAPELCAKALLSGLKHFASLHGIHL